AGIDPVYERTHLLRAQGAIVGKTADGRICVPGRHASIHEHFAHHGGPSLDLVVAVHRPGSDAAGLVAGHAFFRQYGHHLFRVRDVLLVVQTDATPYGGGRCQTHRSTVAWGFNGVTQKVLLGSLLRELVVEAIIRRSPVDDLPGSGVDEQRLAGAIDVQVLGDQLGLVLQDRHI